MLRIYYNAKLMVSLNRRPLSLNLFNLAAAYSFAFFLLLCAVIFSAIVFIMKRNEK